MPRAGARRRSLPCIDCKVEASAWRYGTRRPTRCETGLAQELGALEPAAAGETDSRRALEREAAECSSAARHAATERDRLGEQARLAEERLRALERVLAEQEGLPPAARALAERGARLALGALEIEPGSERAVAAALRSRASAVLAENPDEGLELLERARTEGLGSLIVLAGAEPQELVREFPVVPKEDLLGVSVPSVTPEGFGYDPARRELWFAGETAEAVLLELEARRRGIEAEVVDLERRALEAALVADETAKRAEASAAALGGLPVRHGADDRSRAVDRDPCARRAPREWARSRSDGGRALRRAAARARRRRCAESG